MPDEGDAGVLYLRALKRSQQGQPSETGAAAAAGAAPAPIRSAANGTDAPRVGVERRRSPRYRCEGSAELRVEGCDVRTWGTFTDISWHGCYVEMATTFPVGTILNMQLTANSFQVAAKGEVRVNYPGLGIGVAFSEVSAEDRARLRELLGSLSRPSVIVGPGVPSSLSAVQSMPSMPVITDPQAAINALVKFFENRQLMTQEEFSQLVRKSQPSTSNAAR